MTFDEKVVKSVQPIKTPVRTLSYLQVCGFFFFFFRWVASVIWLTILPLWVCACKNYNVCGIFTVRLKTALPAYWRRQALKASRLGAPTLTSFRAFQSLVVLGYNDSFLMDVLHDGMLNARVLQFLDGLWSGISLSLVSTFVRFFVI
jgi:hypothetical protein